MLWGGCKQEAEGSDSAERKIVGVVSVKSREKDEGGNLECPSANASEDPPGR